MIKIFSSKFFKVLFLIACLAVFIVSLLPGKVLPSSLIWDKAGHFIAYCGLAGICRFASNKRADWQLIMAVIVFSFAIELLQQLIPNRSFEWYDLLANSLGALSGTIIAKFIKPILIKE
ncbi:MAG: VanZ family protein [Gammaproteobacteria bacterium]|nr:VanZ family protein [Gammaproteobacteria bacterium]